MPLPDGHIARCYSLCSAPEVDEHLAITVKRIGSGAGSNWLCDNLQVGDVLEVKSPTGTFVCRDFDRELVFYAAGSGITPVFGLIKAALTQGSARIWLLYANRDETSIIFKTQLAALQKKYPGRLGVVHCLESVQGFVDPQLIGIFALQSPSAEIYMCGPEPFMTRVARVLRSLGTDSRRIHRENYLSLKGDPFATVEHAAGGAPLDGTAQVTLDGETTTLDWGPGVRLLDTILLAGLSAPYSCREGKCSACACRLVSGQVRMVENHILDESDLERGLILACQSEAVSKHIEVTYEGL